MLNDSLQSSFSPAGQRTYNQRLKTLENQYKGLASNVTTDELIAEKAEIKDLQVENIDIQGDLQVENIKAKNIESEDIQTSSLDSTEINAKDLIANTIDTDTISTGNIDSELGNIEELVVEETLDVNGKATIDELEVKKLIEELNLKILKIQDKVALDNLMENLRLGTEWSDLILSSANRPKWNNSNIVTEEQITSAFRYKGSVASQTDLPTTDNELGDVYTIEDEPKIAVWSQVVGGDNYWMFIEWPVLAQFRTSVDQDKIDEALQKAIENTELDLTEANEKIADNYQEFKQHESAQEDINDETNTKFQAVAEQFTEVDKNLDSKLNDAPVDGQLYGRKNGVWSNIVTEGAYVPKEYDKVEKYFSDLTLVKDPAYLETSQLVNIETELNDGTTKTTQYYIALWHLSPSEADNVAYTTKNCYEFIQQNKDKINQPVYEAIMAAWNAGKIIGQNNRKEFQTLDWLDVQQPFDTQIDGADIERPDGQILGTNTITSDDSGVDINSTIGFTANTPTAVSDDRSVINRRYIKDNLKLSQEASEANTSSAILTFGTSMIDGVLHRANCYKPNAQFNAQWMLTNSPWMHRTKDYVYYKVDNVENQSASSFSFWLSIDKNANIINMTNPREDRGNAVAGQSDSEMWMTYHPDNWNGVNDNYAYWPHTHETYGGYITIFNNGRFAGYVEDSNGNSNGIYTCNSTSQSARWVGGKSLRGSQPRILMVNSSSSATDNVKAGIIGLDSNNEEGLNKFRPVQLPGTIKWGVLGLAAGKKHWFAQNATTNTFMVISSSGSVASYVLSNPQTQVALGTEVENGNRNYIELENGDCIFAVRDSVAGQFYFIYCNDNFEEDGTDPFDVYVCDTDYVGLTKWPLVAGNPFIEFGNFVYFFPTYGNQFADTHAWPATTVLQQTYSRFNKTTKSWTSSLLNWNYTATEGSGVRTFKTHDPIEDQDYLWVFQGMNVESTTAPTQAQCLVISESGTSQYVDLGTGSSIHWFNNTIKSGESKLTSYSYNLNPSGAAKWSLAQNQRPVIPFAAVTEEGIGIMFSNSLRDVCIFYGNGHFAIYSYSEANEGGPWSYFSEQVAYGPSVVAGKYGVLVNIAFNNALAGSFLTNTSWAVLYVKPTGSDYLGEPQYFWKPTQEGDKRWFLKNNEGMDYAETDFSNYKKGKGKLMTDITPVVGQWSLVDGMTNYYTESVSNSQKLYLRDGNEILSEVNLEK